MRNRLLNKVHVRKQLKTAAPRASGNRDESLMMYPMMMNHRPPALVNAFSAAGESVRWAGSRCASSTVDTSRSESRPSSERAGPGPGPEPAIQVQVPPAPLAIVSHRLSESESATGNSGKVTSTEQPHWQSH
jgi:hypothetical protein